MSVTVFVSRPDLLPSRQPSVVSTATNHRRRRAAAATARRRRPPPPSRTGTVGRHDHAPAARLLARAEPAPHRAVLRPLLNRRRHCRVPSRREKRAGKVCARAPSRRSGCRRRVAGGTPAARVQVPFTNRDAHVGGPGRTDEERLFRNNFSPRNGLCRKLRKRA